jgi:hypothetical protein
MKIITKEKQKADELIHEFRSLFMDEGEDYGEEILVSILSAKCAKITVEKVIESIKTTTRHCDLRKLDRQEVDSDLNFWSGALKDIEKWYESVKYVEK